MTFPFPDQSSFIRFLETKGELRRVKVEVDPELEITEIACRLVKQQGPALLFENVKGSKFPLLLNPFGSESRIEHALGRSPAAVGEELKALADDFKPPKFSALWKHRGVFRRALAMKPKMVGAAAVRDVVTAPDLDALPILKCWPEDGGKFLTYPLILTKNPVSGERNLGIYRMHVYDKSHTGMHWQIERGGGFHYDSAERLGKSLPLAVVLGADPITMLAGVLPLPEDMDELAFAGFLRGKPVPLMRVGDLEVPADADIVLQGFVKPQERRMEGPFGDHFGHYSHAAMFPVFEIESMYHRRGAVYPAAVVGKPPQEDKYMGNAVQEMFLPILKVMHPELTDLWTYFEAGFHNLAVASAKQRYQKEAIKTALGLFGLGQMSLSKCIILVDPGVNVKNFSEVLDAIRKNFDPKDDFILLPGTSQDTLDFTSFKMNLGSKMILDATSQGQSPQRPALPRGLPELGPDVLSKRNWRDSMLIVRVKGEGRPIVERLVKDPNLQGFALIAAVSEDVPLEDEELLIWGIFTRFDCARDLVPAKSSLRGAWPVYEGPLGIDASWKKGYPTPLTMPQSIVEKVDKRWDEYGIN